jgi:aspartyl-tRNA(Asn)/glutamyl-tRNA(Gln) amidotransferase subunit A
MPEIREERIPGAQTPKGPLRGRAGNPLTIFLARPEAPGPGIPLAVKDLFDTAGLETTYGAALFAGHVPTETATAVERLEAAGYAVVGKTNLHEFAYGTTSENPHFGDVANPTAPGRVAGGSSGGSAAALAAGVADAALGTDSAGSIRIPSACCGVVGHKPTHGLVPLDGCWPLAPSFDTAGPMARDVDTCERMLGALAPEYRPRPLDSLEELAVGVAWTELAEPLVRGRVEEAVERFPRRRRVELPLVPVETYAFFMREAADVHRELFATNADLYGEDVRIKLERCFAVRDADVERAARLRSEYREQVEEALAGVDLVLTPTLPVVAPPLGRGVAPGDLDVRETLIRFTYPFSALGWPALALPCGAAEDGLPASLQIAGRAGDDALVLAAARLLSPL